MCVVFYSTSCPAGCSSTTSNANQLTTTRMISREGWVSYLSWSDTRAWQSSTVWSCFGNSSFNPMLYLNFECCHPVVELLPLQLLQQLKGLSTCNWKSWRIVKCWWSESAVVGCLKKCLLPHLGNKFNTNFISSFFRCWTCAMCTTCRNCRNSQTRYSSCCARRSRKLPGCTCTITRWHPSKRLFWSDSLPVMQHRTFYNNKRLDFITLCLFGCPTTWAIYLSLSCLLQV